MTAQLDILFQLRDLENKLESARESVSATAVRFSHPLEEAEDLVFKLHQAEQSRDLWFGKVADLEAANKRLESGAKEHKGDMENARKIIIGLRAQLADLLKTNQDPVSAEFFDAGIWYPFTSEDHLRNTIDAGYVVRWLYDRPAGPVKLGGLITYFDLHGVGKLVSFDSVSAAIKASGYKVEEE